MKIQNDAPSTVDIRPVKKATPPPGKDLAANVPEGRAGEL